MRELRNRRSLAGLVLAGAGVLVAVALSGTAARAETPGASGFARGTAACPRDLQVEHVAGALCTHGPDAPPAGVDVTRHRSTAEVLGTTSTSGTGTTTGAVPCFGDGTSGQRVQAVYAHAADVPSRYADLAPSIAQWANNVEASFRDSAAATGGIRHVRWVTNADCSLNVMDVTVSTTGDDTYSNTVADLQKQGLNRTDRKYLIWMDAAMYCGVSNMATDDRADAANASNTQTGYARIDQGCWGQADPVEAHELMHTLGGVQFTAPHSTGGGHCTDEYDLMCYADSSGVTLTYSCFGDVNRLFDCNHDDYFSTNPPAGSYLATHWNTANSVFLATTDPGAPPPPAATSTSSWSGSLSRKAPTATYSVAVGTGPLTASLTTGKRSTMSVQVVAPDGTVVASGSGKGGASVSTSTTGGTYSLVVSGDFASFTLTASYAAP